MQYYFHQWNPLGCFSPSAESHINACISYSKDFSVANLRDYVGQLCESGNLFHWTWIVHPISSLTSFLILHGAICLLLNWIHSLVLFFNPLFHSHFDTKVLFSFLLFHLFCNKGTVLIFHNTFVFPSLISVLYSHFSIIYLGLHHISPSYQFIVPHLFAFLVLLSLDYQHCIVPYLALVL
jgi:hypothetical protein